MIFFKVAEMFAFLPREAVTRFLMSCSDCQKRMHFQSLVPPERGRIRQENMDLNLCK